jgi:hypothetical protein
MPHEAVKDWCSAARPGPSLCANGFPQSELCFGAKCPTCGRFSEVVPMCMRDEVPDRFLDETGKPRAMGQKEKTNV